MVDIESLLRDIETAHHAVSAAKLTLERAYSALQEFVPQAPVLVACQHARATNAAVMGSGPRTYCPDCRSYVFPDGRTEAA